MKEVPTVLLILDGYGLRSVEYGNATKLAYTPNIDRLLSLHGVTSLQASGRAVGLPDGYIGNSEVGHLNIGAGRVVHQQMTRIDVAIEEKELDTNKVLLDTCTKVKSSGGKLHLIGLLSDAGVHSHSRHVKALISIAKEHNINVVLHFFTDGRDTGPKSSIRFIQDFVSFLETTQNGTIGTLCGRFYGMDRDNRWDRIKEAWDLIVHGVGERIDDPISAIQQAYVAGETDEFVKPKIIGSHDNTSVCDGDGVLFFNFRADRARELVSVFVDSEFTEFNRGKVPVFSAITTMTPYDTAFTVPVLFGQENIQHTLGEVVSDMGLKQLRIAETEKYAHVTYFFNGGREEVFPGEERILVPSPRDVETYDLKPEMSVNEVTQKLVQALASNEFSLLVCNFANPDMVGHTGNMEASIKALEAVDICVGLIEDAVNKVHGCFIVTGDHGNVEELIDASGMPQTAHTCNPVPLVVIMDGKTLPLKAAGGKLGDIAPTILHIWEVQQPLDMTGKSLLV